MPSTGTDIVPGMAEAIARRMRELGLRPGSFALAAGVTAQGLTPVRRGYRRDYQDKVRYGVAAALRWEPDALERLMRGEPPIPLPDDDPNPPVVTAADLRRLEDKMDQVLAAMSGNRLEGEPGEGPSSHRPRPEPMTGDESA